MKKITLFFGVTLLISLLTGCGGSKQPTTEPTKNEEIVATATATFTPIPQIGLDDFSNKELAGEDENYAIYIINPMTGKGQAKTGQIIVQDKVKNKIIPINGSFSFFGPTVIFHDDAQKYLLLSNGTYTSRNAIIVSLEEKKQAVDTFCITVGHGSLFFWRDFAIYNNCDHFNNRPWGIGEAISVMAINLKTGAITSIAKSDLTHQYSIKQISENTLEYEETSVQNEADWKTLKTLPTPMVETFDLTTLK